jgi:hypothetical protein
VAMLGATRIADVGRRRRSHGGHASQLQRGAVWRKASPTSRRPRGRASPPRARLRARRPTSARGRGRL